MEKPKESPQQQSRLLNRRKSLDPVKFRSIKRELFGTDEFSLKLDDDQPPPPPAGFLFLKHNSKLQNQTFFGTNEAISQKTIFSA